MNSPQIMIYQNKTQHDKTMYISYEIYCNVQCSQKSSDMWDISDGEAQMSDGEISQIWIEHIKPFRQMSAGLWMFFINTERLLKFKFNTDGSVCRYIKWLCLNIYIPQKLKSNIDGCVYWRYMAAQASGLIVSHSST